MIRRRTYSQTLAGVALLAASAAPWMIACGSNDAATATTPTPVPSGTTTGSAPTPTPTPTPASCSDAAKNGTETDVDCGGSCGKCATAQGCVSGGDCTSNVCTGTKCAAPNCIDATKNGTETDIDCGGSCTTKCAEGKTCAVAGDCGTNLCGSNHKCLPISCTDGIKTGSETDIDCGGSTCSACAATKACLLPTDCASDHCDPITKKCVAPTCTDAIKNGSETDIDCGGTCSTKCANTKACAVGADCSSAHCDNVTKLCVAATCTDLIKNGSESDTDCGGSDCSKCGTNKTCGGTTDCASGVCTLTKCVAAACNDSVKNGTETDVDCGGSCATKCADMKACKIAADCTSGVCDPMALTCTSTTGSGSDGPLNATAPTTIDTVASPANGTAGSTALTLTTPASFAVGQIILIHQSQGMGAGNWERNTIVALAGGAATMGTALAQTYSSAGSDRAQAVVAPQYTSVTESAGGSITAPAWDGNTGGILVFNSTTAVTINDANGITMAGNGYSGGVGNSSDPGVFTFKTQGDSYPGIGLTGTLVNLSNAGGGNGGAKKGGCEGGGGGGGGYATAGVTGGTHASCGGVAGGVGGTTYGDAALSQIFFGSGGGSGGYTTNPALGRGGNGGGIVIIFGSVITLANPNAIAVTGSPGTVEFGDYGGGGGGAGGSVYLAHTSTLTGLANVTVTGGAGGPTNSAAQAQKGGAGSDGRVVAIP